MDRLIQIAPLVTWLRIGLAALAILAGVVAYSHYRLVMSGFGAAREGLLAWTAGDSLLRWSVALLATGLTLWGLELGWPAPLTGALIALALAGLAAELYAWARSRPRQ